MLWRKVIALRFMGDVRSLHMLKNILWLCLINALWRDAPGAGMALLVPAYFEATIPYWQQLTAAAHRVPLVAIANIYNGGLG